MGFTFKVNVTADNTRQLKAAIAALAKKELLVGFPADKDQPRPQEPGKNRLGQFKRKKRNAQLAFINEFGSPALNIPPRPFLLPGVESVKDALAEHLTTAAVAALDGNPLAMDAGFHAAGLTAQAGVRNYIVAGVGPPLSPVTIMLRRQRGIRGTKPLIATGQLLNAVTYVVKDRK
jgi:hypothetical protein